MAWPEKLSYPEFLLSLCLLEARQSIPTETDGWKSIGCERNDPWIWWFTYPPIHSNDIWAKHVEAQLSWPLAPIRLIPIPMHFPWCVSTDRFSEAICRGIQVLKRHRALGSGYLFPVVFNYGGVELVRGIKVLFKVWYSEKALSLWRESIILIFKEDLRSDGVKAASNCHYLQVKNKLSRIRAGFALVLNVSVKSLISDTS